MSNLSTMTDTTSALISKINAAAQQIVDKVHAADKGIAGLLVPGWLVHRADEFGASVAAACREADELCRGNTKAEGLQGAKDRWGPIHKALNASVAGVKNELKATKSWQSGAGSAYAALPGTHSNAVIALAGLASKNETTLETLIHAAKENARANLTASIEIVAECVGIAIAVAAVTIGTVGLAGPVAILTGIASFLGLVARYLNNIHSNYRNHVEKAESEGTALTQAFDGIADHFPEGLDQFGHTVMEFPGGTEDLNQTGVKVGNKGDLELDSTKWRHGATELHSLSRRVLNEINPKFADAAVEAGADTAYSSVVARMSSLLIRGATEFEDVRQALLKAVAMYDERDWHTSDRVNRAGAHD